MTWNISHGGTKNGYSYSGVSELGDEVKRVVGWREWRHLKVIFDRRSGDPFAVPPRKAQQVATALLQTVGLLPADFAAMAVQIRESAFRAAGRNEPWEWS